MTFVTKLAIFGCLAATAIAHGTVWGYTADGIYHENFHPNPEAGEVPGASGWYAENVGREFVDRSHYQTPDIICHKGASPSEFYSTVAAGGTIDFHWTEWPVNHPGPVMTYVANCGNDCANTDKETLEWVKIDEAGVNEEGTWASVQLAESNSTWTTTVPETLAPGMYVFRHEILSVPGSQHYPQCINFEVTGNGTEHPEGIIGTEFYHPDDPHASEDFIPGPELYTFGSSPSASATAKSTALLGTGVSSSGPVPSSTSALNSSTAQSSAPSSTGISSAASAPSSTFTAGSSVVPSSAPTSTLVTSAAATPSEASSSESPVVPSSIASEAVSATTNEASPSHTDEAVSEPARPSKTPCISKKARRSHARDIRA